jgi:2-polyprenyl-6-methoxyphenol hydroxylase-like FAD-dependent oxidoreductase
MLLARRGRRVLLVDRATSPSDVVSGHAIQPAGVARLARWGLLERVRASGVPFTSPVRFDFGPVVLEGVPVPVDGHDATVCIRRPVLDALLVDAAAEAGADVRLGFTVKELVQEDGRVVGIRGRDASGAVAEERAPIVVGADGVHSLVARAVAAPRYREHPATTVSAYSYWGGLDLDTVELYVRPGRFVVALPTNDGLAIVAQMAPLAEAGRYRADIAGAVSETFAAVPHLARRLAGAERVERFRVSTDSGGFLRVPHGPGWALAGDAAHHKDPITAQGMLDAFRDADGLAAAIDDGLAGDLPLRLAAHHRARDAAVTAMHDFTAGLADLAAPPAPEVQALIAALAGNPPEISRFLGVIAGSVAVDEFLHPANVERIVAGSEAAVAA